MADEQTESEGDVTIATVKNVGGSVVDLENGRMLAPGEVAENINVTHHHNADLITAGLIAVVETPGDPAKAKATKES